MSKELEAFYCILNNDCDSDERYKLAVSNVESALQRLESIDNANPGEAMKELDEIIEYITEDKKVKYKATILFDCEIIKDALLKAQENEKDKVFLKNLHNTKVKVPLVSIFNSLTQEKRFAYTEHIYYHWEEMKESLEAEIEDIKTEKENLESKAKRQEKVLSIIKEKGFDKSIKDYDNYDVWVEYKTEQFSKAIEKNPTILNWNMLDRFIYSEEEFKLLKRYFGNE